MNPDGGGCDSGVIGVPAFGGKDPRGNAPTGKDPRGNGPIGNGLSGP